MIHVEVGVSPAQKEFFHVPKVLEIMESTFVQNLCGLLRINLVNWKATRRFVQYQLLAYPLQHEKGMKHLVHGISSFLHILSTVQCFEELVEIVI